METKCNMRVKLLGEDGNIFNLVGLTTGAMKKAGFRKEAEELSEKVWECESYDEALTLIMTYVDVV